MVRLSLGVRSFCLILGLLLTSCATREGSWETLPSPATILSTAAPAWQRLAARRRGLQNLKGLAQVRFESPEQRLTIDDMVAVQQGFHALRLEGIGPFGQPLFLMIARDMRFLLYMPRQARFISGTASAENLSRLFGLAVSPTILRYVLMGDVPVTQLPPAGEFRYLSEHNLYVWSGYVPEHLRDYRIWFEPYGLKPVRFEIVQPPATVLLRVQYGNFQRLHNLSVPYHITIEQPLAAHRVVWRYREVQLNVEMPASLFHMTTPAGIEHIELN